MKVKGKKLISLFLVFSLMALASNLYAEKKGADIVVQKRDGQEVQGELIAVKENSFLLMDSGTDADVSVDIEDVRVIKIMKNTKAGKGMLAGVAIGGLAGYAYDSSIGGLGGWLILGTLAGALIGGMEGASAGIDETIEIEKLMERYQGEVIIVKGERRSRAKEELDKILEKLRSKARIKNFLSRKTNLNQRQSHRSNTLFSRFHLTIESGFFSSKGVNDLHKIINDWGFGDNRGYVYRAFYLYTFSSNNQSLFIYPEGESKAFRSLKSLKIEFSATKNIVLGFQYSPLGKYKVQGYNQIKQREIVFAGLLERVDTGIHLTGEFEGNAYFFTGAFMMGPGGDWDKVSIRLGGGLGSSNINLKFIVGETSDFSRKNLCYTLFGGLNYYLNKNSSIGFNVDYIGIPFNIDDFQSIGYYEDNDKLGMITRSMMIEFSKQRANFGGVGLGICLGLHF